MKNSVVRKTFLVDLLNMLLPYYCRGCGQAGSLLCDDCKTNIKVVGQIRCEGRGGGEQKVSIGPFGQKKIKLGEIEELYVGGVREGATKKLIEDYKFKSVKKIAGVLVGIMDEAIPEKIGKEVVIVPLPTIHKHIRQRGFDHARRLAEELAKRRGWVMQEILTRINKSVQVGADEETRYRQAEKAYSADKSGIISGRTYLLLDDVWTTGASMRAAAKKLRAAGAERIVAGVVSLSLYSDR